jgi:acetate CoA/acetoacetate CoA-transferase beta subunit
VISFAGGRARLLETAEGVSVADVQAATEATLEVPPELLTQPR